MRNFIRNVVVLMLVLGMASFASASLQISVGGAYDVQQVTIHPSDQLILDIGTTAEIAPGIGEGYYALVSSAGGSIDIATGFVLPAYATDGGINIEHSANANEYVTGLLPGENGLAGGVLLSLISSIPVGTIFDGIVFHCEGPGDAIVTLYTLDSNFGVINAVDSVLIHQQVVPEPVTMALLGLGGLFLRRRVA